MSMKHTRYTSTKVQPRYCSKAHTSKSTNWVALLSLFQRPTGFYGGDCDDFVALPAGATVVATAGAVHYAIAGPDGVEGKTDAAAASPFATTAAAAAGDKLSLNAEGPFPAGLACAPAEGDGATPEPACYVQEKDRESEGVAAPCSVSSYILSRKSLLTWVHTSAIQTGEH